MDAEQFDALERKVESLLVRYNALERESQLLREENRRLLEERDSFKARIGLILEKLEGIELN
jgi:hypothetical protein